ncbi:aminopeptidase [Paenibacillus flagellatus]|uniref:Aminopeptidase n=1 Tax=Paenibacillus flagellatus TaxID=2211139 RepID=A0A2V5K231_9BACL|nr:aminopeptidase [Paenibacillus flagellatus]PYI51593.1 aminopeptidase [Paenibacillus flagellatus]
MPTERDLEKYAELAVRVGINVQQGQTLVVTAPLTAAELVRAIARKAYEAGAKNVHVEWNDETLTQIKYKMAPDEAFAEYPMFRAKGWEEFAENGAGFLSIYSPNPDLLNGVDPQRIATASKTAATALQGWRSYTMAHRVSWSLISTPTVEWASKVFPDVPADEAVEKLWDVILKAVRVDKDDPVAAWKAHNAQIAKMVDYLNAKQYKQLVYRGEGTDLTVDMPENHVWCGGSRPNAKGVEFNPNMPTEEVFTMPHKDGVNGVVRSTKPLNHGGTLIDNFTLRFENGRVVDFTAEKGYDALKLLLDTDEGARRLGEMALVPFRSPISDTNLIFYNTLYDENASCHFALGRAYPTTIEGGEEMTKEQLAERGANDSLVHVDFMMGSADLSIDGVTADGRREPIFRDGNWAFELA